ncbi:MAG: hypothetical protein GXP58_08480 [Deltaproteobacteria bacterium]|nr:hypothetical protein [Deltaproteobacteria bacterium]
MKLHKVLLVFLTLVLMFVETAYAGRFADAFRKFIVGTDAEAYGVAPSAPVVPPGGVSAQCIACHDGATASLIVVREVGTPIQYRGHQTVNHPIGMSYDRYALAKPNHYTPSDALPQDVRLEEGKVTCISCHKLRPGVLDPERIVDAEFSDNAADGCLAEWGSLTVGPRETDLCLACHVM